LFSAATLACRELPIDEEREERSSLLKETALIERENHNAFPQEETEQGPQDNEGSQACPQDNTSRVSKAETAPSEGSCEDPYPVPKRKNQND
jgi:hypothetical protein